MTITADKQSYLVGLIGSGIGGSLTPAMHEEEGRQLGLQYVYRRIDLDALKLDVAALPEILVAAERMGYNGLNVTYPCKQQIIPLLDELSADARALGAVNTVLLKDGKRIGHNTDWSGFARAFQRGLPDVSLERVVQLGAGGAGAAVAHAALTMGARTLTLFDVDAARTSQLADELQQRFPSATVRAGESLADALAQAQGLIHATPTGMAKLPGLRCRRSCCMAACGLPISSTSRFARRCCRLRRRSAAARSAAAAWRSIRRWTRSAFSPDWNRMPSGCSRTFRRCCPSRRRATKRIAGPCSTPNKTWWRQTCRNRFIQPNPICRSRRRCNQALLRPACAARRCAIASSGCLPSAR